MIHTVIKADGRKEGFDPLKLNRWAEYASKNVENGDWSSIALATVRKLPDVTSSEEIHQTMINVCIEQETLEASRIAARLELAKIRKHMDRNFISDKEDFTDIMQKYTDLGIWKADSLPAINRRWNQWYYELYETKLEFWQIKQFVEKYGVKFNGECIETPHVAALGIGLALHGDTEQSFKLAKAVIQGKVNLPTPALNGGRNGDFDSVSCCVITGGDTVESIGVADHTAYRMTAKKAGIGIEMRTRSKGSPVKGGRVKHLGKHGIYDKISKSVKVFTQLTRGGSATTTAACLDPEIMDILKWKTQKADLETRVDKIDYSMTYNEAFINAVIGDQDWHLFDFYNAPQIHQSFYVDNAETYNSKVEATIKAGAEYTTVQARELLKWFLTCRQETGRVYCMNVSRANTHTPFLDVITLSNLCQEIFLPTKAYKDMLDLYIGDVVRGNRSEGETAFCSLAAINAGKVLPSEYEEIAEVALRAVDRMIELTPAMTPTMRESMLRRRSVGIGITGLAEFLHRQGLDYDGSVESLTATSKLSETHYYYLLKASQKMVVDGTCVPVEGIDQNWLPVDTMLNNYELYYNWERLRGKPRGHSVLVAHMPTESSAVFSDASNGLYPPRERVVYKKARTGVVQFIVKAKKFLTAWEVPNITLSKYYSRVQDFTDQGISADYYVVPEEFPNGKVPLSQLMKEWVAQARLGVKSAYYVNTRDKKAKTIKEIMAEEVQEDDCTNCKI